MQRFKIQNHNGSKIATFRKLAKNHNGSEMAKKRNGSESDKERVYSPFLPHAKGCVFTRGRPPR